MSALAQTENNRKANNFREFAVGFGALRWVTAILVGPVVCSYWTISQSASVLLLVPTFSYLLFLAYLVRKLSPSLKLSKAKVPTTVTDTTACAICSKSHELMHSFSYRMVTSTAGADSLGLLNLVVAKQWTSHEIYRSGFCMLCCAKAVLSKVLSLLFWLSFTALLAFSFVRVGVLIQASIVLTGAAVISPLRHHMLALVKPVELCRFLALEAIDRNKERTHVDFELMSEDYWGSLKNGVEPVESDEELVTRIQIKLIAYNLVAASLINQWSSLGW